MLKDARERWTASLLWIPYTYLLTAGTGTLIAIILGATSVIPLRDGDEGWYVFWTLAAAPVIAAALCLLVGLPFARDGGEPLWQGVLWCLTLPARGWVSFWSRLLAFVFTRFLTVVLVSIGLAILGVIVGALASYGVSGWIIGPVAVVGAFGMVAGGARWGNQYGSGTTGGFPVGLFVMACIGVFGWLLALGLTAALLLSPLALLPWTAMFLELRFDPAWLAWVPVIGILTLFFALPLAIDVRGAR